MASSPSTYADSKAPREDGQILIWPPPAQLLADAQENQRDLAGATQTVQNVPLFQVRRRMRQWLVGDAHSQVLFGDGHQTELHHAGVWAKRVLAHHAASRVGGSAVHFAVDTDAPKHLSLRWPGHSEPISDDPALANAPWAGLVDAPTPAHVNHLLDAVRAAKFAHPPVVEEFLLTLRRQAMEERRLPAALVYSMHGIDFSLGLRHHALLAGGVWESEPFALFVHHLAARAGEVATQYNAALAAYRREKKVRTPTRPMPDLGIGSESIELPFWLDDLAEGRRSRPHVAPRDGRFVLASARGEAFTFDPAADGWDAAGRLAHWLRSNQLRLSPRALTLTMFLRLFVVDQFIHGIGGGEYDQITDSLIASHLRIDPPKFAVATATMYLPDAVGRSRVCVPCIEQEGHRLRHALLGPRKRELVEQISAAPRRSPQRYAAFVAMHRELHQASLRDPAMARWEQRLRDAQQREQQEADLFDRELFYALQPRQRLADMIDRFAASF
jgi:hypothetical protein